MHSEIDLYFMCIFACLENLEFGRSFFVFTLLHFLTQISRIILLNELNWGFSGPIICCRISQFQYSILDVTNFYCVPLKICVLFDWKLNKICNNWWWWVWFFWYFFFFFYILWETEYSQFLYTKKRNEFLFMF